MIMIKKMITKKKDHYDDHVYNEQKDDYYDKRV